MKSFDDELVHKTVRELFDMLKSKQAEVDELQLKLSEDSRVLHNVIDIERKKCEELQKRIDVALSEIESGITGKHHVKSIIKILKGDSHES